MEKINKRAAEITQAFKNRHITEIEMNELINSLQIEALSLEK